MIEQNNRQENEGLIVEAVDVAGIDVLEEDIAAAASAGGSLLRLRLRLLTPDDKIAAAL